METQKAVLALAELDALTAKMGGFEDLKGQGSNSTGAAGSTNNNRSLQLVWAAERHLTREQLANAELARKKFAAIRALEAKRLAKAMLDPNAPQEVKDYAEALKQRDGVTCMGQ